MDNKSFNDKIYEKYEYYKNVKNDSFFNKHHYKQKNNIVFLNNFIIFLMTVLLTTGVVYATSYCINNIWKEPKEYVYEEEKKVKEEDLENSITEEEAKNIGLKVLEKMNINIGNIENCYLNKSPGLNRIEWVIETDKDIEIRINAKNGEIYSFSNNALLNSNIISKVSENDAIEIAKEIYNKLSYEKNYMLSYITSLDNGKWQADFCIIYGEVFNPYQCVRITFIPKTKELIMLNIFDYDFENNPYQISEEQAITIVKNRYGEGNIQTISAKKDIQKMNAIIYQKENPSQTGEYMTEDIVRNVWNIEVTEKKNGYIEQFYVDATTGEIIGGDQTK